jgi:hypothetical protein
LDAHAARTGEAVSDHVAAAAEDARLQPEHLDVHAHRLIPIDPSTRLDIDLLVLGQLLLEDVGRLETPQTLAWH